MSIQKTELNILQALHWKRFFIATEHPWQWISQTQVKH